MNTITPKEIYYFKNTDRRLGCIRYIQQFYDIDANKCKKIVDSYWDNASFSFLDLLKELEQFPLKKLTLESVTKKQLLLNADVIDLLVIAHEESKKYPENTFAQTLEGVKTYFRIDV